MTVSLVTTPTYESLSGIDGNSYNYTRNSSMWTGTASFTYKPRDNMGNYSSIAIVTINIVNQTPIAVGGCPTSPPIRHGMLTGLPNQP